MAPLGKRGEAGRKPRAREIVSGGFGKGLGRLRSPRSPARDAATAGRSAGWGAGKAREGDGARATGASAGPGRESVSPGVAPAVVRGAEKPGTSREAAATFAFEGGCGLSGRAPAQPAAAVGRR